MNEMSDMQKEEFRAIKDYEGRYEISNLGRVRSLKIMPERRGRELFVKAKILKQLISEKGYYFLRLYKNGIAKNVYIHRLVAMTFISNTENKKEVNHMDGIKTNNNFSNLEWVSRSENMKHAYHIGLIDRDGLANRNGLDKDIKACGENNKNSKLKELDVLFIRENAKKNGGSLNIIELANMLNVSKSTVKNVVNRKYWTHI